MAKALFKIEPLDCVGCAKNRKSGQRIRRYRIGQSFSSTWKDSHDI